MTRQTLRSNAPRSLGALVLASVSLLVAREAQAQPATARPATIQRAADFSLTALDGKSTVRLADHRGKVVVLNFWATWCQPCRFEIPWLIDVQKKYADRKVQIIGVSTDRIPREEIAEFARKMGINYPVGLADGAIERAYGGIPALPTTLILSRNGDIVARIVGMVTHEKLESAIEAALAIPLEPRKKK